MAQSNPTRCDTCRHWALRSPGEGVCAKGESDAAVPLDRGTLAWGSCHENAAYLMTKAAFGCVMHEAKAKTVSDV